MPRKRYIQLDANGVCFSDLEYMGQKVPRPPQNLMDVTTRADGPFLGRIYDAENDTFADPPPEQ